MLCPACRHDNPAQAIDSRVLTILCALSLAFALPVNAQTTCPSMCGTNGNTELVAGHGRPALGRALPCLPAMLLKSCSASSVNARQRRSRQPALLE
jgi:hypothetical protein